MPTLLDPNLAAYRTGMLDLARRRFDASQARADDTEEDRQARRELNTLNAQTMRENIQNLMEQRRTTTKAKADEEAAKQRAVKGFRIASVLDMLAQPGNTPSAMYERFPNEMHAIAKNHPNWLEMKPADFAASAERLRKKLAFEAAPIEGIKSMLSGERAAAIQSDREARRDKEQEERLTVSMNAANIADMLRKSGVKLSAQEVGALAKATVREPGLLSALPDELQAESKYLTEAARARNLLKQAENYPWSSMPTDTRPWYMSLGDKPAVLAVTGFDEKNMPSLLPMDADDAKKEERAIVGRAGGGYTLNGQPLQPPKPMGPLLQRLKIQPQAPAGEVVERQLRDGTTVRVRRMPDGSWAEVE